MKNIFIKSASFFLLSIMLLGGCTGAFEEINTSPSEYAPNKVDPKFVLGYALTRGKMSVNDHQNTQLLKIDSYAQYFANDLGAPYNSYNQSALQNAGIGTLWSPYTYPCLNSLNTIIRQYGDVEDQVNVIQIARIFKSFIMLRATDVWGDIPYFQACDGSGEAPPYDKQQDIYDDIFKTLADAVTKFDPAQNNPLALDVIYDGNYENWKRFANSLRLRMAMRISFVDPARAKTEAESAIAAGLISNTTQRASVKTDANSTGNQSPFYYNFSGGGYGMSLTFENILSGLGGQPWSSDDFVTEHPDIVDPRGPIMFNPCATSVAGDPAYVGRWVGSRPGLISGSGNQTTASVARMGRYVWSDPIRRFNILKYSEVCFLLAEAKVRFPSWNTGAGTAESWYVAGIRDNMAEWGIAASVVDAYLASNSPNVNGTTVPFSNVSGAYNTELDKIITQKWLAMFPDCGWEAWADHRRLQMPKFIPYQGVDAMWFPGPYDPEQDVPQNYIRRLGYPETEQSVNKINLANALAPLGGSLQGYVRKPMWWDPYAEDGRLK